MQGNNHTADSLPIYLDYLATTPLDPSVLEEMLPFLRGQFGNPSSATHWYGWQARQALDRARDQLAQFLQCAPRQITFTSGATEATNTVFELVADRWAGRGGHIIVSAFEHKSVLACAQRLQARGFKVDLVKPSLLGAISVLDVVKLIREDTRLISVMMVNNEIGTIQPVGEILRKVRDVNESILIHADVVQAIGKVQFGFRELGVDFCSLSAHKIYGPKGIGALLSKNPRLLAAHPFIVGGSQESGMRAGTENVAGVVGFGAACKKCAQEFRQENERIAKIAECFLTELTRILPNLSVHASGALRIPHALNLELPGVDSVKLLQSIGSGLAFSTGSACTSQSQKMSHVLASLGVSEESARHSIRISFGRYTQQEQAVSAAKLIGQAALRIGNAQSLSRHLIETESHSSL